MKLGRSVLRWNWGDINFAPINPSNISLIGGRNASFNPFELSFRITSKTDHAGVCFRFGVKYLFFVCLKTYDHRHWNGEENRWEDPDDR